MDKNTALKMAIEALDDIELCDYQTQQKALKACKKALEHKTRIWECEGYDSLCQQLEIAEKKIERLKAKQPAQEPVAVQYLYKTDPNNPELIPLYTHPAPTWQGLTSEEIRSLDLDNDVISVIFQTEKLLKEKNS